jgi:aldehyde:ferredoxin oxidoreductase
MGSKLLRAIVVTGTQRTLKLADPDKLNETAKWFARSTRINPALVQHRKLGTSKGVVPLSTMGMLPSYNFQDGSFKAAEAVCGETMEEEIGAGTATCFSCAVSCKRVVEDEGGELEISKTYGGPEYESIGVLGPLAGMDDIRVVAHSNELCNALGLDTISTGGTIAWALECAERGLITAEDTGGIPLKWNDPETYHKLIRMIAHREGFGNVLAEGSLKAAHQIGRGSARYAMQSKGQEFPAHEPRGKWGVGLGYAVSPTGADHLQAAHDPWFDKPGDPSREYGWVDLEDLKPLGITEPVPAEDLSPAKVRLFTYLQYTWSLHDVLDWCIFVNVPEFRAIGLEQLVGVVASVTGWQTSLFEMLKAGERGITMARAYNYREGFTGEDDSLPERMFEPMREGTLKGHAIDREQFTEALKLYYEMMGWDQNGKPTRGKLAELDIAWIWDQIADA